MKLHHVLVSGKTVLYLLAEGKEISVFLAEPVYSRISDSQNWEKGRRVVSAS